MELPRMKQTTTASRTVDYWKGLNRRAAAAENEFREDWNLSADHYPILATRRKRGIVTELSEPQGMETRDGLLYIDDGKVYLNGTEVTGLQLTGSGVRQLVAMGAYTVIFPDGVYLNTEDLTDFGSINASAETTGDVTYEPCDAEGASYEMDYVQPEPPEDPQSGDYWLDTSGDIHVLKQYSGDAEMWVQVPTVYTMVSANDIGKNFQRWDGVEISGADGPAQIEALNGSRTIEACGEDFIVITGLIDQTFTQTTGSVTVSRQAPDMDFVVECGNRLWGCKYGMVGGKPVNELYCSALGDFRNFRSYRGLAGDSWAASRGADGQFTGAITYLGTPIFFRETSLERVYPSDNGAHNVTTMTCRGVQRGCWRSLQIVGETLYYKANAGVCAYQGALPVLVSDALGSAQYSDARAGAIGSKYYISMKDEKDEWGFYCYEATRQLWHREDDVKALMFAAVGEELYCIDEQSGELFTVYGSSGDEEPDFFWCAETGVIGLDSYKQKTLTRISLRGRLDENAFMRVLIEYDSNGTWIPKAELHGDNLRSFLLPIRARRCDHCRIRLEGHGGMMLYSAHANYRKGSDEIIL